jgi:hypothetical protein
MAVAERVVVEDQGFVFDDWHAPMVADRQEDSIPRSILDTGYSILDPPTHPILPADDADNADPSRRNICVNLRDLRENILNAPMSRVMTSGWTIHFAASSIERPGGWVGA